MLEDAELQLGESLTKPLVAIEYQFWHPIWHPIWEEVNDHTRPWLRGHIARRIEVQLRGRILVGVYAQTREELDSA
jgi:hypothetical protein